MTTQKKNQICLVICKKGLNQQNQGIQGTEISSCVNMNEAYVQKIANAEIREHSEGILDEEVTKSSSNAAGKQTSVEGIRKICKNM